MTLVEPSYIGINEELFWPKVHIVEGECWQWLASKNTTGYGQFWNGERLVVAHRYCYELMIGPVAPKNEMDHLCRNRACVNPAHLEPVSHSVNVKRGIGPTMAKIKKGQQTHCLRGHEFTKENTRINTASARCCRTCGRHRSQQRRDKGQRARTALKGKEG